MRSILVRRAAVAAQIPRARIADRDAEGERQRLAVPAGDEQAAEALDQVADRVDRRDGLEPVVLDQVARQRAGAEEEQHEHQREDALDGFAVSGPQPDREADRAERDADHGGEREEHEDPGRPGLELGAEGERDDQVGDAWISPCSVAPAS